MKQLKIPWKDLFKRNKNMKKKFFFKTFQKKHCALTIGAFPPSELLVFETHLVNSVLHGNGNEIIVNLTSASDYYIFEWIMQHLQNANGSYSSTPHMVIVKVLNYE